LWRASSDSDNASAGTRDGSGASDNDRPYRFGVKPRVDLTFPFSERQFARLLVFKSHYQSRLFDEQLEAA
jgi:hypothetical protein